MVSFKDRHMSYLPHSRDAYPYPAAPKPLEIVRDLVGPQPGLSAVANKIVKTPKVKLSDLQEGDVLLMLGKSLQSCLICVFAASPGSSHTGVVVKLDGKLFFAESVIYHRDLLPIYTPLGVVFDNKQRPSGILASDVERVQEDYEAVDVYRPPNLTETQKDLLRNSFLKRAETPYIRSGCAIFLVAFGCPFMYKANQGYFCSELTATMFSEAGLLKNATELPCYGLLSCFPCRKQAMNFRPYDIPHVINMERKGALEGTKALFDVSSFHFNAT